MTPRGRSTGTRTRTGTNPPDALTRVSRTDAMSGPGACSLRITAMRPRASAGVCSCSGLRPLAAICSSSAAVAWSSAIVALLFAGRDKALVAACGHGGAAVAVGADAPDVGEKEPGLAGDVGTHVPGRRLRVQGVACDLLHVLGPVGRRPLGRLDDPRPAAAQPGEAVADPLDVLLDGHRHVAEHRRAAGPGDREQVREAGNGYAQVGARPFPPRVPQRLPAPPADAERLERSGERVEPGGIDDDVKFVVAGARPDA